MTILVIGARFPYPAQKGDQLRMLMFLRYLSQKHRVIFVCTAESPPDPTSLAAVEKLVDELHVVNLPTWQRVIQLGRLALYGLPFQVGFFYSPQLRRLVQRLCRDEEVDVLLCQLARTALYGLSVTGIPRVLEYQDAYSLNMQQRFQQEKRAWRWISFVEWRLMRRYERRLLPLFDLATIISERDRHVVGASERLWLLPHGMNFEAEDWPKVRYRLVFSGNLHYFPNREAIVWFSQQVFPLVRQRLPDASLDVVGAEPTADVLALAEQPGIEVTANVPDIRPYIGRAEVAVAPMRSGSGTQTKVLEALALGTPIVLTPHARQGLDYLSDDSLVVAEADAGEFAQAVVALLEDKKRQRSLVEAGRAEVMEYYSWEAVGRQLERVLVEAVSWKG